MSNRLSALVRNRFARNVHVEAEADKDQLFELLIPANKRVRFGNGNVGGTFERKIASTASGLPFKKLRTFFALTLFDASLSVGITERESMKGLTRSACLLLLLEMTSCQHRPAPPTEPPYQKPASLEVRGDRTLGSIERLDAKLDELLAPDAKLEKLAQGFDWSEGPIWLKSGDFLLFSDVPQNVVYRWKEGEKITEFLKPSGYTGSAPRGGEPGSNGLTVDSQGRLVLCEHGDRRVARLEAAGKKTTLVDRYQGKRFNSPNDLTFHSNGDLYFTDPPYGLEGKNDDPKKELPFNGVYRLKPSGELTLLTDKLTFPNGIAFSPDEKILYVAVSDPKRAIWMAYDVKEDGMISNGRVFFDSTSWVKSKKGLPDGLKVDAKGNLFATGPGGVLIFSPDGKHLGTLNTGEATANCNWGNDGSVLYVTADMYLCRIKTKTKGARL